jgi:hypothetical protein
MDYLYKQKFNGRNLFGRHLNQEYFIEPCAENGLADLEVNVNVVVKLKNMDAPIVFSRSYIPTAKPLEVDDVSEFAALYDKIANSKKNGKFERGPIYDYQLKRLHSIRRYLDNEFEFKVVKTQSEGCYDAAPFLSRQYNYFDSGFCIEAKTDQEVEYNFEWSYDKSAAPWAYEICSNKYFYLETDVQAPISWKLKAKLNEGDEWTLIDEQKDCDPWTDNNEYSRCAKFDLKEKNKPWQYYRLEVTKISPAYEPDNNYDRHITVISNLKLLY